MFDQYFTSCSKKEYRPQKRRRIYTANDKGPNVYRKRIRDLIEAQRIHDQGERVEPTFVNHDLGFSHNPLKLGRKTKN